MTRQFNLLAASISVIALHAQLAVAGEGVNYGMWTPDPAGYLQKLTKQPAARMQYMNMNSTGVDVGAATAFVESVHDTMPGSLAVLVLEPTVDLQELLDSMDASAATLDDLFMQYKTPMMIRFAHEMNTDSYPWGQRADYGATFCALAKAIKKTNSGKDGNIQMLWSPYLYYPEGKKSKVNRIDPYDKYYPGDECVDAVGLTVQNKKLSATEKDNSKSFVDRVRDQEMFDEEGRTLNFYDTYSKNKNKPFIVAETSAATYRGMSKEEEQHYKMEWLEQLYSPETKKQLPNLQAVMWFDEDKSDNDSGTPVNHGIFNHDEDFCQPFIQYLTGANSTAIFGDYVEATISSDGSAGSVSASLNSVTSANAKMSPGTGLQASNIQSGAVQQNTNDGGSTADAAETETDAANTGDEQTFAPASVSDNYPTPPDENAATSDDYSTPPVDSAAPPGDGGNSIDGDGSNDPMALESAPQSPYAESSGNGLRESLMASLALAVILLGV